MSPEPSKFSISDRPIVDTLAAAAVALLHAMVLVRWADPWSAVSSSDRMTIFASGAAVVAVVAALAAVGMAAGGNGPRAQAIRKHHAPELRRNWRALVLVSAVSPCVVILAQVVEANGETWAPYVFEFAVLWTLIRMARLAWLIEALTKAEDLDISEPERRGPMPLNQDFLDRTAG